MRRLGLVFGGGGAKGAYETGVWWGFKELGIDKEIVAVSGSSVGGLNAALFAMNDFRDCFRIWQKISGKDIICAEGVGREFMDIALGKDGMFSQDCLRKIMERCIFESRLGCTDCFISCTDVSRIPFFKLLPAELYINRLLSLKPVYFNIKNMEKDKIIKVLLATSALPFIYEGIEIDGKRYCDGGICDNLPIKPLYDMGIRDIIVVSLNYNEKAPEYTDAEIKLIKPSEDLGDFVSGTLNFSREKIERLMRLGYRDFMEIWKKEQEK